MPRPIAARIHLDAIRHNLRLVKRSAPTSRVWSANKATAHEHGIERVHSPLHLDEAVRARARTRLAHPV